MLTADRQIDRRILLEADSLEAAGWRVKVIAMPLDQPDADDGKVIRIDTRRECAARESLVLHAYRKLRSRLPMNGRLMQEMKRIAWRYLVSQESFYSRLFRGTASKYRADIIVAHDLPMLPLACELARECGARVIYDSHELFCEQEFSAREKRTWEAIEAKYIRTVAQVITVNESIARELARRYGLDKVEVILNADRASEVPPRTHLFHDTFQLAAERKVLLFQGGLSAGRNLAILIDAMGLVRNPSVALVILGDGVLLSQLRGRVKARGLEGRVFFHKAVPQSELLRFTAAGDAGVIPYQATCMNNYWCTPNKLFEFIAAGLPILASDLPELRAFVEGNNIGAVGDLSAPEGFAKRIDGFFADVQRLEVWRENLRRTRLEVSWEREQGKLLAIYENCLRGLRVPSGRGVTREGPQVSRGDE